MDILIVTQKVDKNDQNLGFFHEWIAEFAKHFDKVTVICLEKGVYDLPSNVKVLSLGKEQVCSRARYVRRFYSYIWSERNNYDAVFVHMNPEYVLLGGLLWKILCKSVFLWYTHKSVDLKLRFATFLSHKIFTASPESFRLKSDKVVVTGHGIDIDKFSPLERGVIARTSVQDLISVGRISPTKNQLIMVRVLEKLLVKGFEGKLVIVGDAVRAEDYEYKKQIESFIAERHLGGRIVLTGGIPHENLPDIYRSAAVFINLSTTGSIDKAVLEAMACGLKVVTSNEAFGSILSKQYITDGTLDDLVGKIIHASSVPDIRELRDYVVKNHSLSALIARLRLEIMA